MFLLRRTPHRIQKDLSGKAEKMLRYWFCVDCFVEKVREERWRAFHLSAKPEREPIGSIRMSFFRSAITFSFSFLTISILSSTREIGQVSGTDFGSASTSWEVIALFFSKRDLRINRYHIICVTRTDMTQLFASLTSSHRGMNFSLHWSGLWRGRGSPFTLFLGRGRRQQIERGAGGAASLSLWYSYKAEPFILLLRSLWLHSFMHSWFPDRRIRCIKWVFSELKALSSS